MVSYHSTQVRPVCRSLGFFQRMVQRKPDSEPAIEAIYAPRRLHLRNRPGIGGKPVSDISTGYLGNLGLTMNAQPVLVGLVINLLSGSASKEMRSYLYYLQGSISADSDSAIDYYRKALMERADNIEAMAALAKAYADKNDKTKALFYIKQARVVGIEDQQIEAQLNALEVALNAPQPQLESTVVESNNASAATSAAKDSGSIAPATKNKGAALGTPEVAATPPASL